MPGLMLEIHRIHARNMLGCMLGCIADVVIRCTDDSQGGSTSRKTIYFLGTPAASTTGDGAAYEELVRFPMHSY